MTPQFVTFDRAFADMLRYYWGSTGVQPDTQPYGTLVTLLEANAFVFEQQSYAFKTALEEAIVTGTARALGVEPEGEKSAVTTLAFSRATIAPENILIPSGTRVQTLGLFQFETTADATILLGTTIISGVLARAVTPGDEGNVDAGTIIEFVDIIPGVEVVANTSSGAGGQDAETASALSARVARAIARLAVGSAPALTAATLAISLVNGERAATAVAVDNFFDNTIPVGTARVYVYRPGGTSLALRDAILDVLEVEQRPVGVSLAVLDVTRITVNTTVNVRASSSLVQSRVEAAVRSFYANLTIGEDVDVNRLERFIQNSDDRVYTVIVTPSSNTTVARYERAELGTLSVVVTIGGAV